MSFDWNLSSDEETGFEDWAQGDFNQSLAAVGDKKFGTGSHAGQPAQNARDDDDDDSSSDDDHNTHVAKAPQGYGGIAFPSRSNDFDIDDDSDEEDVNWEDAHEHDTIDDTAKLPADTDATLVPAHELKPVTLDLQPDTKQTSTKKASPKRIARKRYRFERLTPDLQFLLSHLEKSHLLGLTAHAIFASRTLSQPENLGIAHSLIPAAWIREKSLAPSEEDLHHFCNFFFHLVHPFRHQTAESIARMPRRRRYAKSKTKKLYEGTNSNSQRNGIQYRIPEFCKYLSENEHTRGPNHFSGEDQAHLFVCMMRSLGWRARYVFSLEPSKRDLDINHPLFVALSTRNVFQKLWKKSKSLPNRNDTKQPAKRQKLNDTKGTASDNNQTTILPLLNPEAQKPFLCWVEVLCRSSKSKNENSTKLHWVHVDPQRELINAPAAVETITYAQAVGIDYSKTKKKQAIPYVLAAEHVSLHDGDDDKLRLRLTDVTPRYASSFVECLKSRGIIRGKTKQVLDKERIDHWWNSVLKSVNAESHAKRERLQSRGKTKQDAIAKDHDEPSSASTNALDTVDNEEEKQLTASRQQEPLPTSKTGFKTSPIYVLPSLLNSNEVLKPDAKKRVCGMFKGEFVFRRSDVEAALIANKWLYKGRKVKADELQKPIARVKARKKANSGSFKALKSYGVGEGNTGSEEARDKIIEDASKPLGDGMENLYASWQTESWSPSPVGPSDDIPVNEHNNIELALLNPGLVHIDERFMAKVAKRLNIPYAPCLLGFEGHGGNRTPTIRGIVVHMHNEELLREAHAEMESHFLQEEHEKKQRNVMLCWKRLLVGVLTKDRLERAYGDSK